MLSDIIIVILVVMLIYCILKDPVYDYFTMTNIKSDIDGITYPVVSKYEDKQKASDLMAGINVFTRDMIQKLKATYIDKDLDPKFIETPKEVEYRKGKEVTLILLKRYNSSSLKENEPETPDKTAYTINKGDTIALCLREKVSGKNEFHDLEILKFVMLHELAHIITKELDHTQVFWTNFRFLLEFCEKNGIYTSANYFSKNSNYCGLPITYTPVLDKNLMSYFK